MAEIRNIFNNHRGTMAEACIDGMYQRYVDAINEFPEFSQLESLIGRADLLGLPVTEAEHVSEDAFLLYALAFEKPSKMIEMVNKMAASLADQINKMA